MSYIQGFIIPVPDEKKKAYREIAEKAVPMFEEYGAIRIVETWGTDLREGKITDFYSAVKAKDNENIVFSWIVWPDKATCDAAAKKMESDERMKMPDDMPFDASRMIYGGFEILLDTGSDLSE